MHILCVRYPFKIHTRFKGPSMHLGVGETLGIFFRLAVGLAKAEVIITKKKNTLFKM